MRWPWKRRETRASYTDAYTSLLIAAADGEDAPKGNAHLTAAVEAAAGLWARAFACADVSPDVAALDPVTLARIARSLIVSGESLHLIDTETGALRLLPIGDCDVSGQSPNPATWRYKGTLYGPDGSLTVHRRAASIVHIRYSEDPSRPWRGVGPLVRAGLSADLLSAMETRLGQEASAKSAYVVPSPVDGEDDSTDELRDGIGSAKGGVRVVETMATGWGDKGAAPFSDWMQSRIGFHPPDVLRALRSDVGMAVAEACGVPSALIDPGADGTAQREAWRRFAHGSVAGVARIAARELAAKLDAPGLAFGFDGLYASDIVGRAGAFQRMVAGGMDAAKAASLSGLMGVDG